MNGGNVEIYIALPLGKTTVILFIIKVIMR